VEECRNCGSHHLRDLGFSGEVAPFFLKRALNLEIKTSLTQHPLRLLARWVCALPQRFFTRVYGSSAYIEMQICLDCTFVQSKHAFSDEALGRLYADYRSPSYNEERIRYEPTYAAIATEVGAGEQEIRNRVGGLTAWLAGKIEREDGFSMLDFGGSDGRFLPQIEGRKFVFEISNIEPRDGIVKIVNETDLGRYSYVQIAHVLEHAPEPLRLIQRVSRYVEPGGYLYIEVPQERSDAQLAQLQRTGNGCLLTIHEHINLYSRKAVDGLLRAAGLEPAAIEAVPMDLGWTSGTVLRVLCRTEPSEMQRGRLRADDPGYDKSSSA